MGRTNPTYRDVLGRFEERWQQYRRGLRRQYQTDFDRLLWRARRFADAGGYANPADPERAILLSILLSQEIELRKLRETLAEQDLVDEDVASDAMDMHEVDAGADDFQTGQGP